eukprot:GHUV01051590.1.p1 GENE.GHUV01051590.1~~GHUV01051590.1.p1  ORF type:complete len:111 (-),score=35.13 GHUV01051590.1:701-1033(-)
MPADSSNSVPGQRCCHLETLSHCYCRDQTSVSLLEVLVVLLALLCHPLLHPHWLPGVGWLQQQQHRGQGSSAAATALLAEGISTPGLWAAAAVLTDEAVTACSGLLSALC